MRKEGPDAFQERINGATPLSRYLFNRQSEGLDLTLPEDRGELKARVEPLLKKMPRSTLRDAMWHEMLRLCGNNRGDWQNRRQPNGKGGYGERRVQEQRIDVKLSKDTQLCLALLEAPDMASEIAELCRSSRQYRQAGQFASWILEHAIKDRRSLVRELATDNRAREQFYSLFDGIEHIPAREQTLAGAREMLNPHREVARKQRLASLLSEKRSLADLSAEERLELKALTGQNDD